MTRGFLKAEAAGAMNAWLLNEALRDPPTNLCRSAQGHQLPHRLVAVVAAVPPKPAAPTPGLRSESLPHSAAGMNPSPTVIKS